MAIGFYDSWLNSLGCQVFMGIVKIMDTSATYACLTSCSKAKV